MYVYKCPQWLYAPMSRWDFLFCFVFSFMFPKEKQYNSINEEKEIHPNFENSRLEMTKSAGEQPTKLVEQNLGRTMKHICEKLKQLKQNQRTRRTRTFAVAPTNSRHEPELLKNSRTCGAEWEWKNHKDYTKNSFTHVNEFLDMLKSWKGVKHKTSRGGNKQTHHVQISPSFKMFQV